VDQNLFCKSLHYLLLF